MRIGFLLLFLLLGLKSFTQSGSAIMVSRQTDIEVINSKLIVVESIDLMIINRDGDQFSRISIPYSKLRKVSEIEGWIKGSKGEIIRKLKNSEISDKSDQSAGTFFNDTRIKTFNLNHSYYPYTLHYSYKTTISDFVQVADWYPTINTDIPTLKATLTLKIPEEYRINIRERGIKMNDVISKNGTLQYMWSTSYKDIKSNELYSPPMEELMPNVSIVPIEFRYSITGSFETWESFGFWIYNLLTNKVDLPGTEITKISAIIAEGSNKRNLIRKLYHYLQDNTRYVNISMNTGGLKPYSASYVANNKYGDCKALTNYFRNVLKVAGIESYYTTVLSGTNPQRIDGAFPSQQFDHIILFIPMEKDSIWLDCTSTGPFNYLGTFTQNRTVLVIDKENSRLLKTPALQDKDVVEIRYIDLNYNMTKNTPATIRTVLNGRKCEIVRSISQSYNQKEQEEIYLRYFTPDKFSLDDFKISSYNRDSTTICINSSASGSSIYRDYGNEILAVNLAFDLPEFEKPTDRENPVRINYPTYLIDTIAYDIPPGFSYNTPQAVASVKSDFGIYSWEANLSEGKVIVRKSFQLFSGEYDIEVYDSFYNFIKEVQSNEKKNYLIFNKTAQYP